MGGAKRNTPCRTTFITTSDIHNEYNHDHIYHPSRIMYYSSTHFVLFDHYYLLLIITLYVVLFSPTYFSLMADANAIDHPRLIIYYSSTHFVINPLFCPLLMVDANIIFHPTFYLILLLFRSEPTLQMVQSTLFLSYICEYY